MGRWVEGVDSVQHVRDNDNELGSAEGGGSRREHTEGKTTESSQTSHRW